MGEHWIEWPSDQGAPSHDDLRQLLEDYLGQAGVVAFDADRFHVTLPGPVTYACRRVGPSTAATRAAWREREDALEPRRFEVWRSTDGRTLNIIGRSNDRFTGAVAAGFAELCASGWSGTILPP